MFKWVSWVIRMGATALLLSFLCIWTTGYIVNSYMETVIKQLDLPLDTQPFALSGVWGSLWGADESPKKEASASPSNVNEETSALSDAGDSDEPTQSPQPGAEASSSPVDETVASPDLEGEEASASPEGTEDVDSTPAIGDQIEMEQLTNAERQALYAMVVSKLNQDQLKLLSDALQEGSTADELVQVQSMLKAVLTDDEYSEMVKVLEGKQASDSDL